MDKESHDKDDLEYPDMGGTDHDGSFDSFENDVLTPQPRDCQRGCSRSEGKGL